MLQFGVQILDLAYYIYIAYNASAALIYDTDFKALLIWAIVLVGVHWIRVYELFLNYMFDTPFEKCI